MISSLLHLVGLRPRACYTLTNFKGGGGQGPFAPPLNTPLLKHNKFSEMCLRFQQCSSALHGANQEQPRTCPSFL